MLFLKSDSNTKHSSFFEFDFNVKNKISSAPTRLLNFQEFSKPSVFPNPLPCLLSFQEFFNLLVYFNPHSIRHSRVGAVSLNKTICIKYIDFHWGKNTNNFFPVHQVRKKNSTECDYKISFRSPIKLLGSRNLGIF